MPVRRIGEGNAHWSALFRELMTVIRFGIVGIVASLIHMGVVWTLLRITSLPPLMANTAAFLTAFVFSFSGHYWWTFQAAAPPLLALVRFFVIACTAFGANTVLLSTLLELAIMDPGLASVVSVAVIPGVTFLMGRLWGFR